MFDLKTASLAIRKSANALGIKSGKWEPVDSSRDISAMEDNAVVARVINRNHPNGIEITAGDVRYAEQYLI
jgi:hypothetical protein